MTSPLVTVSSSSRLSNEAGRALLTIRGQHLVTDSPPPLGGPNEAPNPVEFLLSALGGCAAFICDTAAKEMGIALHAVNVVVAGDFDPRGVCGESVDPRFQAIRVRFELEGPEPGQIDALIQAFRTRCPIYATLARSVPVEVTVG